MKAIIKIENQHPDSQVSEPGSILQSSFRYAIERNCLVHNRFVAHLLDQHATFLPGVIFGLVLAGIKFAVTLPIDVADLLYGSCLLVTLVITLVDFLGIWDTSAAQPRAVDFVLGLLYPLDAYAVLILFGVPMPD
jgi:hypothetical protein